MIMNVIITHEQADFDAIASLLGASLVNKQTVPVLPQRVNRNVKVFLEIYRSSYPFMSAKEMPKEPIDSVTLVDTQSLITLKGISKETQIEVFDHHEEKSGLPGSWDFNFIPFGATTTFFVNTIINSHSHDLTMLEATLLLLGIYEDTGSLTYTNTTPQDAKAVSFLLENNANLQIASEYLNPPLSPSQQAVFQDLLENSNHLTIQGLEILIAQASAPDLDDEVSSIAHKMNELFEPDALFIFIGLREGIRLVARSSTDRVDTARIARMFGGGGHQRASAALIRNGDSQNLQMDDVIDEFRSTLDDMILPAVRVRNIMSKKPLTLSPDTTVEEARELMERYGYEGFPVIDNGKIIGLLNRRSVDKAHTHNLKKTASSLMEAGHYFVVKNDTLDYLKDTMARSGWGQIPVISSDNGNIVGIVTRTDLLKAITGDAHNNKRLNLGDSIRNNIAPGAFELLQIVSTTAADLKMPIYVVGGFVRDLILEKPSPDFDIVVEGDAIQLSRILVEKFGGKVTSHKKFGTAKWHPLKSLKDDPKVKIPIDKKYLKEIPASLDLISARTEFYEKPTALPTIKQSSIKLDLHRRDFAINTMAIRLDGQHFGEVYDYWGGLNDLENGKVRVLHSLSFVDDPTRMLRAVRFEKRFHFDIEKRTLELLREAIYLLDDVSGDRIRHELDQIFIEENAAEMLERLDELGILTQIHPSLSWKNTHSKELELIKSASEMIEKNAEISFDDKKLALTIYIILLGKLLPQSLNEIIKRLRFKSHIQQILRSANMLWHHQNNLSEMPPGEFSMQVANYSPFVLSIISFVSENEVFTGKITKYLENWRHIEIYTTGDDLKDLGIPPGPIYQKILKELKKAWINGDISSEKTEKEKLDKILEKIT